MSFYETPVRRLCVVRACACFVLALALGAFPFVAEADSQGRIFAFSAAGFCALIGIFNLWRARRASPLDTVTPIPDRAPAPEQVRYFRRMLWLSAAAFPTVTAWVAYDLHRLESGAVERVSIWAPISVVYERFGYWPVVLSVPGLGVICAFVFIHKLRKLASNESTGNA